MLLSIAIAIFQQSFFIFYLLDSAFLTRAVTEEARNAMLGIAIITTFMSFPAFIWNFIMVKEGKDKKDILGMIISIATFVFCLGFLVFSYVTKVHILGERIF